MQDLTVIPSRPMRPSVFARRLIVTSAAVYAVAGTIAVGLIEFGRSFVADHGALPTAGPIPPALWAGTVLLGTGSWWMQRSVGYVRREKQRPFRRSLLVALVTGTLFVGVQSFGLWCLLTQHWHPTEFGNTTVAAVMFVGLHALHFLLALLALVYVSILASADRYDHEYYWGVSACAAFWHFLGVVWIVLLLVMGLIL